MIIFNSKTEDYPACAGFSSTIVYAGGGFSGLTSQTLRPLSCGSDRISVGNPARPHTSDRYAVC